MLTAAGPNACPLCWQIEVVKALKRPEQEFLQQQLDQAARYFGFRPVHLEVLAETPFTILVTQPGRINASAFDHCLTFLAGKALRRNADDLHLLFRSVELARLGQVIRTGCDVIPSTAPMFAACSGKALEYGGSNKVVQVFDPTRLEKTFTKVHKSESPKALERLIEKYPSCKEVDGEWLWLSKLPPGDFRIATDYATEYSFYIPGNPLQALMMIFLVGEDPQELRAEFHKQLLRLNHRTFAEEKTKGMHKERQVRMSLAHQGLDAHPEPLNSVVQRLINKNTHEPKEVE